MVGGFFLLQWLVDFRLLVRGFFQLGARGAAKSNAQRSNPSGFGIRRRA